MAKRKQGPASAVRREITQIVDTILRQRGWTQEQADAEWGVPQSTISGLLDVSRDSRLSVMIGVMKGLGDDPISFFARHPKYADRLERPNPEMAELEELLTPDEAKRLLDIIREHRRLRVLTQSLDTLETLTAIAQAARSRKNSKG